MSKKNNFFILLTLVFALLLFHGKEECAFKFVAGVPVCCFLVFVHYHSFPVFFTGKNRDLFS